MLSVENPPVSPERATVVAQSGPPVGPASVTQSLVVHNSNRCASPAVVAGSSDDDGWSVSRFRCGGWGVCRVAFPAT